MVLAKLFSLRLMLMMLITLLSEVVIICDDSDGVSDADCFIIIGSSDNAGACLTCPIPC